MGYQILQRPLDDTIIEKIPLQSEVLLAHSTANPGAGDEAHFSWLNQATRHGWANYYLDHDSISQLISEGFQAPSAGASGNKCALSFEMCEPATNLPWAEQVRRFNETWARAVWLAADILHRYQWGMDKFKSHAEWSELYPKETDHTDPIAFFARFGKTWGDFVADVNAARIGKGSYPPAEPWLEGSLHHPADGRRVAKYSAAPERAGLLVGAICSESQAPGPYPGPGGAPEEYRGACKVAAPLSYAAPQREG